MYGAVPADPVKVMLAALPAHTVAVPKIVAVGNGSIVTVPEFEVKQPSLFVMRTVYCPGIPVLKVEVLPGFVAVGGTVQLYVYWPDDGDCGLGVATTFA